MKYIVKICFVILFSFTSLLISQERADIIKRQASLLMSEGRFKEAIDQLNKYISSNPREAEGYHIRGLCFEKTTEYQYAVLDLRRARRLDPNDAQIKNDLDRVISIWHQLLYKKIDGHKRDIAVNPNNPFSYLEIGKSYRWLEEWGNAEIWYDEYLKRDQNASPDEIIRYTEILAKTGSITKGERILKIYVERYPDDWRLWSRFGYFSLWLSKYRIAQDAFEKSLSFKPFFQEALDGLDLAKNQAYLTLYQPRAFERVYPIDRYYSILEKSPENEELRFKLIDELILANRYDEAYQQLQFLQAKYSEDDRFKTLYQSVSDFRDSTLNRMVQELTDSLKINPANKEYVMKLATSYANLFYYDSAIEILEEYLVNIPEDQDLDARFRLAQYSAWNYEWEKAISILTKLLELEPENLDYQLLRGQIGVWTVLDFDIAEKYLLNVAEKRPKDIDAPIALASMYAWKKNFPEAKKYVDLAKTIRPNSIDVEGAENNYALHLSAYEEQKVFEIRMEAGKLAADGNCEEAVVKYEEYKSKRTALTAEEMKEYASFASCAKDYQKAIAIYDSVLAQQFDYDVALKRAREYYNMGDSLYAVTELETLSKIKPEDQQTRLYLADAYTVTNQLSQAEIIYRDLRFRAATEEEREFLLDEYDFYSEDEFIEYYKTITDSIQADTIITLDMKNQVDEKMIYLADAYVRNKQIDYAEEIYNEIYTTTNNQTVIEQMPVHKIYLADAYTMDEEYGDAKSIYYDILEEIEDTSQIRLINQRLSWLPPTGFAKGINSLGNILSNFIPTNVGISPFSNTYYDNQNFTLWNFGMRMDAGFIGFLGLGASWSRIDILTNIGNHHFIAIKGTGSIYFSQRFILSGSVGVLNIPSENSKLIGDVSLRYDHPDVFSIAGYYENNDARLLLYSPTLFNVRLKSELFRLTSSFQHRSSLKISGQYSLYRISDKNYGNDLLFRIGKKFIEDWIFGYEYFFSDYAFVSSLYYSPQDFASHSIWAELNYNYEDMVKLKLGGKIGYVPKVDFLVSELFGEANYTPFQSLSIVLRLGYSSSYRYDSNYEAASSLLSVYWNIF